MALTPIDIQKMEFKRGLWGCDPGEVENFLLAVSEELASCLGELEKLERENRYYKQRLQESQKREGQLQETLVHVQKVSEQIAANARREGELIVRQAEGRGEQIVSRSMEEANRIESKISELRMMRRELHLQFRQTLDFFERILQAEVEEERAGATIHTLPPSRPSEAETKQQTP